MRRTVKPSQKMSQPRLKRQKSGKWAFFHFPKFRITCIIRNNCNQKREAALLSLSDFRQLLWMLFSLRTPASTPLDVLPVCSSV